MKKNVSIVGLGYVGLPIAVLVSKIYSRVNGIDINAEKVKQINSGISVIEDISDKQISEAINDGNFRAVSNFSVIKESEVILICVPTPLKNGNEPDLSFVEKAAKSISVNLSKGALVILESTVMPGTTRDFLIPILENGSGLSHKDFFVAFSPERVDPVNKNWNLSNTPKIVSGINHESSKKAFEFYSEFIDEVIECKSLEVAETAKLLENSFRLINISFINEISMFCQKLGIDVIDVIDAASTKPYGFMPFFPSVGVGGHCIPVDPQYLANKARELGTSSRFIDLADQINREMPEYFVGRAEEKLGGLKDKRVLVVGVSYKPNVADVRETPAQALITGLKQKSAQVYWHDDLVKSWNGEESVSLSSGFDLAIIATPHEYLDLTKLGDTPILNTRGSI